MSTKERKGQILVVDDDPRIGKILQINLGLSGYDVITTTRGAEAIEIVRSHEPDIVLLDVVMPEITGLELLEQLRRFSQVPVILFTGHPKIVGMALASGANDSIVKPFDLDLLAEKIRRCIGRKVAHGNPEQDSPR